MAKKHYSNKFIAAQVAGSCRLEGIRVSKEDETLMTAIIAGEIDANKLRQQRVNSYRKKSHASDTLIGK